MAADRANVFFVNVQRFSRDEKCRHILYTPAPSHNCISRTFLEYTIFFSDKKISNCSEEKLSEEMLLFFMSYNYMLAVRVEYFLHYLKFSITFAYLAACENRRITERNETRFIAKTVPSSCN